MIDTNFKIVKPLGCGNSSRVFLVEDAYENLAAVKIIRNDKKYDEPIAAMRLEREHKMLNKMSNHPNIIRSYYTKLDGQMSYDNTIENIMYNVIEYAHNGSLANFINYTGAIEENICRFFMTQICDALMHIHQQGCAHLDLKLENILLDKYFNIKLADMGSSVNVDKTKGSTKHRRGTPIYMPPEIISLQKGKEYNAFAADIYSLGVTLFVLLTGEFPNKENVNNDFTTVDTEFTTSSIEYSHQSDNSKKHLDLLSPEVKSLIQKMIDPNPNNRPTIEDVLHDDWLNQPMSLDILSQTFLEMDTRRQYMQKYFD